MIATLAAAAAALLVVAATFTLARLAVDLLSVPRVDKLVEEQVRGARALLPLVETRPRAVAVLTLLSTVARVAFVVALVLLGDRLVAGPGGVGLGAVVAALTLYVMADAVPARIVARGPERPALALAGLLRGPVTALAPLVATIGRVGGGQPNGDGDEPPPEVTVERLHDLADVAAADGTISASTHAVLRAALELNDTVVREIMVPRPDMISVPATAPLSEVVSVVLDSGHSRIPVHGDDRDHILGVVYARDLLAKLRSGGDDWASLLRPPLVVPELKNVENLLRELQTQQVHLVVVVDEYGATVGLVTIEDILEELVGEIVDEFDHEQPLVEPLEAGRWRVDARLPVDDLAELVRAKLPEDEWDTVGGLIFGMLGHVAKAGECVAVDGVQLTAEQVRGRRISKVLVERPPVEDDDDRR